MGLGTAVYATAIVGGCAVALATPLWWAAIAALACAETASALAGRRGAHLAEVVELAPRRAAAADELRRAA